MAIDLPSASARRVLKISVAFCNCSALKSLFSFTAARKPSSTLSVATGFSGGCDRLGVGGESRGGKCQE